MASTPQSDWRLTNQEKYLKSVSLSLRKFQVRAAQPEWDHEHCEFCWAKVVEKKNAEDTEFLTEAYATEDGARWICPQCFADFREQFGWILRDAKNA
jgi:rubrerythrin